MTSAVLGGCLCGDVRYRFSGEPLAYYVCHCLDCQRQTGSAFGLSMIVPADHVEGLASEPARFEIAMPDGRTKRGRHCARCATRVWGEPAKWPQLFVLRPGTFDEPPGFAPFGDIWTRSARPWITVTAGPQFPGQPEDSSALVKAWQSHRRSST